MLFFPPLTVIFLQTCCWIFLRGGNPKVNIISFLCCGAFGILPNHSTSFCKSIGTFTQFTSKQINKEATCISYSLFSHEKKQSEFQGEKKEPCFCYFDHWNACISTSKWNVEIPSLNKISIRVSSLSWKSCVSKSVVFNLWLTLLYLGWAAAMCLGTEASYCTVAGGAFHLWDYYFFPLN